MDNITIVFCNFYHIGDTHFSQPFVKNIVVNNPNNDYYIFNNYNTYCYLNEINNVKDIKYNIDLKKKIYNILNIEIIDHILDESNLSFNEKINACDGFGVHPMFYILYDAELKLLLINTWIGCIWNMRNLVECNLVSYNESNNLTVNDINNMYNLNIKYDNTINLDILPSISMIYIESFLNIKNNTDKKIIFYYNYLPKSGQSFLINNENEHNLIIKHLSLKYIVVIPHKNIELENYIIENNITSIIFAQDLIDISDYYSCKNLYYYAQMAYDSHISVYFDTGRSFLYMNKNFIIDNNNNLRIHFANNKRYYEELNDERIIKNEYIEYIKYIEVYTYNDIIDYFNNI